MTQNTGLLTARCDPYGAESSIRLGGGMYPESMVGRIMWHCSNQATARYRMICQGGKYGMVIDTGDEATRSYLSTCEGGHRGQEMPLCLDHRREIAKRQSGLCPPCAWPAEARALQEQIDGLILARNLLALQGWDLSAMARIEGMINDARISMDEMRATGRIHNCRLKLVEVS